MINLKPLVKLAFSLLPRERGAGVIERYARTKTGGPTAALVEEILFRRGPLEDLMTYLASKSEIPDIAASPREVGKMIAESIRRKALPAFLSEKVVPPGSWVEEGFIPEVAATVAKIVRAYPREIYTRPPVSKEHAMRWVKSIASPLTWGPPENEPVIGYHVTTNIEKVGKEGLRGSILPLELGAITKPIVKVVEEVAGPVATQAGGLGGVGTGARISMTVSKEAAKNILETLPAMIKIARGEMTTIDFLKEEVNRGRKEYVIRFLRDLRWRRNIPKLREAELNPRMGKRQLLSLLDETQPQYKEAVKNPDIDGEVFKWYLEIREGQGGPANPIFLQPARAYAQLDPEKIGVVGIVTSRKAVEMGSRRPVEQVLELGRMVREGRLSEKSREWTSPDTTEIRIADPRRARIFETALLLPLLLALNRQQE
ncbi:MAG: hypothetical protein QXJ73_08865 [Candidatus Caldarchaeum sp.]